MITLMKCSFGSGTVLTLLDNATHCVLVLDGPGSTRVQYPMKPDVMRELAALLYKKASRIDSEGQP